MAVKLPPVRHNKTWTRRELRLLKQMYEENVHVRVIAYELGRSEQAIYAALGSKHFDQGSPASTPRR